MSEGTMTANMQQWQRDLESFGKVDIKTTFTSLIWRVGLAIAILGVVIYLRYQAGDIGQRGLTWAIVGSVILILGCIAFVKVKWGNATLSVSREGVVTTDGNRIPWGDITDISVFNSPRSGQALQVNLTQSAWDTYMGEQNSAGKAIHGANKFITRNRGIVQPEYLAANPNELAAWMNQFPQGQDPE